MKCLCGKQMVSAETPMLMSKACEIFIQELTFRAWMRAEESNKSTVQPCDVAKVIMQNDALHFLTDIVPDNLQNFCAYGAAEVSPFFSSSFIFCYTFHLHSFSDFLNLPSMEVVYQYLTN